MTKKMVLSHSEIPKNIDRKTYPEFWFSIHKAVLLGLKEKCQLTDYAYILAQKSLLDKFQHIRQI